MPNPESSGGSEISPDHRTLRFWGWIAWPSFLAACLLEALVFALVDPAELRWPARWGSPSPQAIYTAAFFVFWFLVMACSRVVLGLAGVDSDDSTVLSDKSGH